MVYKRKTFSRSRKVYKKKPTTIKKAITKARRSNFVKAVKSVISSQSENKMAYYSQATSLTMFNSGINSSGDMLQVIPNIARGTADHERVGDQISAKWCSIKGYLKLNINDVTDSTTLPSVFVRMFLVTPKYRLNYGDAVTSTSPLSGLLKKGGTTSGFTGLISDMYAPVNTDLFTLHSERKFYMSQNYIGTPVGTIQNSNPVSSDIKNTVKFFSLNWKCRNKSLKYDANVGSSIQPVNASPILLIGYCYLDGSTADTVSTNLGVNYTVNFSYEDM